jgi:predicted AAA+ superfamily ATPase
MMKPRAYFDLFLPLVKKADVRRAIVLMGPRRVGKTVMIHHTIQALLTQGVRPTALCYFSVDHPIYNGLSLERLLEYYLQAGPTIDQNRSTFFSTKSNTSAGGKSISRRSSILTPISGV